MHRKKTRINRFPSHLIMLRFLHFSLSHNALLPISVAISNSFEHLTSTFRTSKYYYRKVYAKITTTKHLIMSQLPPSLPLCIPLNSLRPIYACPCSLHVLLSQSSMTIAYKQSSCLTLQLTTVNFVRITS